MKAFSLEAFSLVHSLWDTCFKCWPDKCHCFAALQFDVICQNLWEDSAETSPQRAMENCAEYHRENNCSASTEWPECEFDQLCVSFRLLLLVSSLSVSSTSIHLPPLVHLSPSHFLHLFNSLLFPHNTQITVQKGKQHDLSKCPHAHGLFYTVIPCGRDWQFSSQEYLIYSFWKHACRAFFIQTFAFLFCSENRCSFKTVMSLYFIFSPFILCDLQYSYNHFYFQTYPQVFLSLFSLCSLFCHNGKYSVSPLARSSDDLQCCQGLRTTVQTEGNFWMRPRRILHSSPHKTYTIWNVYCQWGFKL